MVCTQNIPENTTFVQTNFMSVLIFCILLNVLVGVIFKLFNQYNVDILPAIIVNYFVCVFTAGCFMRDFTFIPNIFTSSWVFYAMAMGIFFFVIFMIIARTVAIHGVMVSTTAQKLSLILPVLVAVLFFNEVLTGIKALGIASAITAVILIAYQKQKKELGQSLFVASLPFLTWLGSNFVDLSLYLVEKNKLAPNAGLNFTAALFLFAGIAGFCYFCFHFNWNFQTLNRKNVFAGFLLGIPNFFSIYLVLYLLEHGWVGSVVFPILNVSIILITATVGILVFKEQLTLKKSLGFGFAILAIVLLSMPF